jgi:hypothetical protein
LRQLDHFQLDTFGLGRFLGWFAGVACVFVSQFDVLLSGFLNSLS